MIEAAGADRMTRDALAAHGAGRLDARTALAAIDRAIELEPDFALAHRARGMLLHREKRLAEAAASLRRAHALDRRAAPTLLALAHVLHDMGDIDGSRRALESVLAADPRHAEAHIVLGSLLGADPNTAKAALAHLRAAAALSPDSAWAHEVLGELLDAYNQPGLAEASLRTAVDLGPDRAPAWGALAVCLARTGRFADAGASARKAVALVPDQPAAQFALALAGLARGDLAQAWPAHEHRLGLRRPLSPVKPTRARRWLGEPLAGASILVWREEGLGDELRYATCLPDLAAVAGRAIWEASPRLVPLYARSFPSVEVRPFSTVEDTEADFHVPVGSLPLHFRKRLGDFPRTPGYLRADPGRAEAAKRWLRQLGPGLAVGMCWRSRNVGAAKQAFSSTLAEWTSVFRIPDARFICLQYGDVEPEIAAAESELGTRLRRMDGLDLTNDLDGVAALISALDVVVTARTTVAALAGAVGRPALVFVTDPNEWALGQSIDPWFPGNRLFYRSGGPGWKPTLDRIAAELAGLAADKGQRRR